MKKNVLLVILLILIGYSVSKAQSSLLATLSHEGDVKVFYGAEALINAHEAAVSGDVITLSSGTFKAVNITKAVTIRGTGMAVDTVNNIMSTVLMGSFNISESDENHNLIIEGIYHDDAIRYEGELNEPKFIKCRFSDFGGYRASSYNVRSDSKIKNATFLNCSIHKRIDIKGFDNVFNNCIVEDPVCCYYYTSAGYYVPQDAINSQGSTYGSFSFYNCVINFIGNDVRYLGVQSDLYNCIVLYSGTNTVPGHGSAYNNITVGTTEKIFKYLPGKNTNKVCDLSVFKTYSQIATIETNDEETFELTDEAAAKYLGRDKTQVGIYGGSLPYNTTIEAPRIVKCDVASKSTSDGKLSVDIQVEMAE